MASSPGLLQKIRRRIVKTSRCTYDILDTDTCNGMEVYMKRCHTTQNPYSMQDTVTKDIFNGNIHFTDFPYQLRFVKDEGLGHFTFDPDVIAPELPSNEEVNNRIEVPVTIETPKKHVSPPRLKRLDPNKKNNTLPRRNQKYQSDGTMSDITNGNRIQDAIINCRNSTGTLDAKKRLPPTPPGDTLTFSTFKGEPVKEMGPPPPQLPPRNKHANDLMSRSFPVNDNDHLKLTVDSIDNEYVRVGDGKPLPKISPPLLKPLRNRTMSDSSEKNRSSRSMSESSSDQNVKMRSISESSSDQNMKTRSSSESSTELMKTSVLESPEEGVFPIDPVPEIQNDHLLHEAIIDQLPLPPPPLPGRRSAGGDAAPVVSDDYPPPPDFLNSEKPLMTFPESPGVPSGAASSLCMPRVSDSRDTVSSLLQSPEEGSTSGVTDLGSPDRLPNVSDYKVEEIREVPMTGQVYAGVNRSEDGVSPVAGREAGGTTGAQSGGIKGVAGAVGGEDDDEDYDVNAEDGGFFEDVRDDIMKQDVSNEKEVHHPPPLPDRNYRAETLSKSNQSSEEHDDHDYSAYHSSGYAGVDLQEPIHMTMEEVWQEARSKGIPLAKPQALSSPNKRTKHKDDDKHKRRSFFKEKFKMPNFFRSKSEPDGKRSPRLHKKTLSDVTCSPVHTLSPVLPQFASNTMGKQHKHSSSSMTSSCHSMGEQGRCSNCKDQSETSSEMTTSAISWAGQVDFDDTGKYYKLFA